MNVEVFEKQDARGEWVVEAVDADGDGGIDVVIFAGPVPEDRAREYAAWKYPDQVAVAA